MPAERQHEVLRGGYVESLKHLAAKVAGKGEHHEQ